MPVFFWRAAVFFFKFFIKKAYIFISDRIGNICYVQIGIPQKPAGADQALSLHQFLVGVPGSFFEKSCKIVWVHIKKAGS